MLNLHVATGTIKLQVNDRDLDAKMSAARQKLLRFPTKVAISFTANTAPADAAIAALKARAGNALTLNIGLGGAAGLSRQLAGVQALRVRLARPIVIPITANAMPFHRAVLGVQRTISALKRGAAINLTLNPWEAHRGITQVEQRLAGLRSRTAIPLGTSGGGGGLGGGLGMVAGIGLTAAATATVGTGVHAVERAGDVQAQIADLRRITGFTADQAAQLQQQLQQVALSQPGAGIDDLLKLARIGGKMGIGEQFGATGLKDFAAGLGAVHAALPESDVEKLADNMARTMHLFQLGPEYVRGFGSALIAADNATTASAEDILDLTQRMAGAGRAASMTLPQLIALAAVMKDVGLRNESGATAFNRLLSKMGTDQERFAKLAGVSKEEFGAAFNQNPLDALGMVMGSFKGVKGGASERLKFLKEELGFNNQRDIALFGQLSERFKEVDPLAKRVAGETGSQQSLSEGLALQADTFKNKMAKLSESADKLARDMGEPLLKPLGEFAAGLTRIVQLMQVPGPVKTGAALAGQAAQQVVFGRALPIMQGVGEALQGKFPTAIPSLPKIPFPFGDISFSITDFLRRQGVIPAEAGPARGAAAPGAPAGAAAAGPPGAPPALPAVNPPGAAPPAADPRVRDAIHGFVGVGGMLNRMIRTQTPKEAHESPNVASRLGALPKTIHDALSGHAGLQDLLGVSSPAEKFRHGLRRLEDRAKVLKELQEPSEGSERGKLKAMMENMRGAIIEGGESLQRKITEDILNNDIGRQQLKAQEETNRLLSQLGERTEQMARAVGAGAARFAAPG